jgi:oxygen-independent coproporphyrinogen-3 oxidase
MMKELEQRKGELPGNVLQTIYFGGGTPSLLSPAELSFIFEEIMRHFSIAPGAEITLEANPDDLSDEFLAALKSTPVNRLSIGIQSFRDTDLRLMNRAHNAAQAIDAVQRAKAAGFTNLTLDLIYGVPGLSPADWDANLEQIRQLDVPHLSAYCLTVEPRTALAHQVKTGQVQPVDDEQASVHFQALLRFAKANGYAQYEISNFAREGFIAKHNSSYWFGEPYLGIGPSAHSFHGNTRRWNISNNARYIRFINENAPAWTEEILTPQEQFNEHVMTRLRTMWGISVPALLQEFGDDYAKAFVQQAEKWMASGDMAGSGEMLVLTEKGKLIADRIASDLFIV